MSCPAAAISLPLTREVDFAKQKTEGEKNEGSFSPPVSHKCSTAPSLEGVLVRSQPHLRGKRLTVFDKNPLERGRYLVNRLDKIKLKH